MRAAGFRDLAPVLALSLALGLGACAQVPETPMDPAMLATLERQQAHPCVGTAARAVSMAGVPADRVTRAFFTEKVADDDDDYVVGYLAWIRVAGQPGYLIADMDQFCRFTQVYSRDGMKLAGVSAW